MPPTESFRQSEDRCEFLRLRLQCLKSPDPRHPWGGEVSNESLQGMDGNRFIKPSAIALRFAGMKTDPTTGPRKRVFLLDQTPGPFNIALIYLLDEGNDIVPCWTGCIAGRCLILIKRLLGPPCTCLVPVHVPTGNGNLGHLRGTLQLNLFVL